MKSPAEFVAGVLFGVGALVHLGRLLCPFDITIGYLLVPLWTSSVFFVLGGLLSAWLFRSRAN